MNRRALLLIAIAAVLTGLGIGYIRALPSDFVKHSDMAGMTDYGYRCGDGSEFTLVPTDGSDTVRIVPATSVDYVREANLESRTDAMGMYYEGDDIVLRPTASGLMLVSAGHGTTTCSSMQPAVESLFNLGA